MTAPTHHSRRDLGAGVRGLRAADQRAAELASWLRRLDADVARLAAPLRGRGQAVKVR